MACVCIVLLLHSSPWSSSAPTFCCIQCSFSLSFLISPLKILKFTQIFSYGRMLFPFPTFQCDTAPISNTPPHKLSEKNQQQYIHQLHILNIHLTSTDTTAVVGLRPKQQSSKQQPRPPTDSSPSNLSPLTQFPYVLMIIFLKQGSDHLIHSLK